MTVQEHFMAEAMRLAERGRPLAYPNPLVGAVLVKSGRVISQGYHATFGGPHAEAHALASLNGRPSDAILYVTLEPCAHYGKTPPCVKEILRTGIRRVVVGALDPNPVNRGRGIRELRRNGVEVCRGVLARAILRQNEVFAKWITQKLPFVSLKMAQSLDGKIATVTGKSRWITGENARGFVRALRSVNQAVLVGKKTALLDDPQLNSAGATSDKGVPLFGPPHLYPLPHWGGGEGKGVSCRGYQPVRIILDRDLQIPLGKKIFHVRDRKLIAVCSKEAYKRKFSQYDRRGIGLLAVPLRGGRLHLRGLLHRLAGMGIASLLIEGGGETVASFLEERLVDKVFFFIAPKIIGGSEAKTSVEGVGIRDLRKAIQVQRTSVKRFGSDLLIEGYPVYP